MAPSPISSVNSPVCRSSTAIALASCTVTNARVSSWLTAMYSGSKSIPVLTGRRRLAPEVGTPLRNAVFTTVRVSTSMMLTLPGGSIAAYGASAATFGVPSLATSSFAPSCVKVSMSGREPTPTSFTPEAGSRVLVS